jgi:hypothetical protein
MGQPAPLEWTKEPFVGRFLQHRSECGRFTVIPYFGAKGARVRWQLLDRATGGWKVCCTAAAAKAEAQRRAGGGQ